MISKDLLKSIIIEQRELFVGDFVDREKLALLKQKAKSDFIIIVSGIRRCGKSVLIHLLKSRMKERDYYLNFDDNRLNNFTVDDFDTLYEVFVELFGEQRTFYFDEIQNVDGWESFVRRLHDYNNKVYITGSNAKLLSKELGTRLTGRYIPIELYPASFKEYLAFKNVTFSKTDLYKRAMSVKLQKAFREYVKDGGFFKYLQTYDKDFFKILYDNILYRDIITRHSLSHVQGIKDMYHYLMSNISKEFSYTTLESISNISSITTIKDYITYFENAYLLFVVRRYSKSLKTQLVNPKKVYAIDTGLANNISFKFSEDFGRVLENVVFLELRRLGKEVYYHSEGGECDFIIKEGLKITEAIQVTYEMLDDKTRKREIDGLLDAMSKYKLKSGTILTNNEEGEEMHSGKVVKIIPVWKWLLS